MEVTKKSFAFCTKNDIPLYYVSASDGTNVVKVTSYLRHLALNRGVIILQCFNDAIEKATAYKKDPIDIDDQILDELERM